MRSIHSW